MKQPQWITLGAGAILTIAIFVFGRTVPHKKHIATEAHSSQDGHDHGSFSIDSFILDAKKQLTTEQVVRLSMLENTISRGAVKDQQLNVYHQLSHFWRDSVPFFASYAWYEAEAARLENSEKSLTFAAHLFLRSLQEDPNPNPGMIRWKALQASDLFERSLKINPANDSSRVGLGACYLFGNISATPMKGINMIREVTEKDSTNIYAQMMLVKGSLVSGQFDKAISRLNTVCRMEPDNIEAILMLADLYERTNDKAAATAWYRKSLEHVSRADLRTAIETRIKDLSN